MTAGTNARRAEPKKVFSARVRQTMYDRATKLTDTSDPYAPSLSEIVDRGLELACEELERRRAA
jgi:hypothetical protein